MSRAQTAKRRAENEIEFSRIVAFSDGVFAIAITLLVLNLGVSEHIRHDDLWPVLRDQGQDLFAYGLSFAVIGRFWVVHLYAINLVGVIRPRMPGRASAPAARASAGSSSSATGIEARPSPGSLLLDRALSRACARSGFAYASHVVITTQVSAFSLAGRRRRSIVRVLRS